MTSDTPASGDNNFSIPVCDLSSWHGTQDSESRQLFLDTWDYAFRTFGFLLLVNHGLEGKYRALTAELKQFFNQPLDRKLKFRLTESYGYGGYTPQGQESVSRTYTSSEKLQRPPDAVESLVLSSDIPHSFPCLANGYKNDHLKAQSLALQQELDKLTLTVMEIMAVCLNLPRRFFQESYRGQDRTRDLRAAHYLPGESSATGCMRYGEHTDYTGFTFLWRNQDNGLQCLNPHGQGISTQHSENDWTDVPLLPDHSDALVVNAGDLIQRWTNSYWISNVHRVAGPGFRQETEDAKPGNPISIVYFTGPAGDTKINVLSASEKVASTGPVLEEYRDEITADEHLQEKLNASNE